MDILMYSYAPCPEAVWVSALKLTLRDVGMGRPLRRAWGYFAEFLPARMFLSARLLTLTMAMTVAPSGFANVNNNHRC